MTGNERIRRDVARIDASPRVRSGVYFSGALGPKEIAAALGVSETSALRLLRRGEIRGRKVGKLWRVHPAELAAYLKGEAR